MLYRNVLEKADLSTRFLFLLCFLSVFPGTALANVVTLTPMGRSDDAQINAALARGGKVYLKAGTYVIDNPIVFAANNVVLSGDRGARIQLASEANWPSCENKKCSAAMFMISNVQNVGVSGFEVDGNAVKNKSSNDKSTVGETNYYTMFYLNGAQNVEISHMYLHDNWGDVVFATGGTEGLNFHDNVVRRPGRTVVTARNSGAAYVSNNCMRFSYESAIRSTYADAPLYAAYNDVAVEPGYTAADAALQAQKGGLLRNCDNAIANVTAPTVGPVKTGGCPVLLPSVVYASCSIMVAGNNTIALSGASPTPQMSGDAVLASKTGADSATAASAEDSSSTTARKSAAVQVDSAADAGAGETEVLDENAILEALALEDEAQSQNQASTTEESTTTQSPTQTTTASSTSNSGRTTGSSSASSGSSGYVNSVVYVRTTEGSAVSSAVSSTPVTSNTPSSSTTTANTNTNGTTTTKKSKKFSDPCYYYGY